MGYRSAFLGSLAGMTDTGSSSVSEANEKLRYERLVFHLRHRGGNEELLGLALMALREHLKSRSLHRKGSALAATGGEERLRLPSGSRGPSEEEIRAVSDTLRVAAGLRLFPAEWDRLAEVAIRALNEYRARKREGS